MSKPTKQQLRLAEKSKEVPLLKYYEGGDVVWTFANGDAARKDVAENCLSKGLICPRQDGLFGDSQTYAAVS